MILYHYPGYSPVCDCCDAHLGEERSAEAAAAAMESAGWVNRGTEEKRIDACPLCQKEGRPPKWEQPKPAWWPLNK